MHVLIVVSALLMISNGVDSLQGDAGKDIALDNDVTMAANEVVFMKCKTGFGAPGECVDRKYCDYGTKFIDFTTYAPKGYVKTCKEKEVCCPTNAQFPIVPDKSWSHEEGFDFDEDD